MASRSRKQKTFHFVNADPSSETKSQTRSQIRSHVGKWVWHQMRKDDDDDDVDGRRDDVHHGGKEREEDSRRRVHCHSRSTRTASTGTFPRDKGPGTSTAVFSVITMQNQTVPANEEDTDLGTPVSDTLGQGSQTQSSIGSNVYSQGTFDTQDNAQSLYLIGNSWDPFKTYPTNLPSSLVAKCNEYSTSVLWPSLTPGPSKIASPGTQGWLPLSMTDPTLFTALLFGSLSHRRTRDRKRGMIDGPQREQENRELIMCETTTIQLLNEAIADPSRALSDGVILAVLAMASNHHDEDALNSVAKSPFTPPLKSLQWLDVYGTLALNPVHARGLCQLVDMRGGLEKLTLPGLAETISYSIILNASKSLSRPGYPFIPFATDSQPHTLQARLGFSSEDIKQSFGTFCKMGFTYELAETFQAMHVYQGIVELYCDGALPAPDLTTLIDQRNLVQHTLMSLPPGSELDTTSTKNSLVYEVCRLAAITYNLGVLFPLPISTVPFQSLTQQLKEALQESKKRFDWGVEPLPHLLLWVLAVGGIASTNLPERPWFVAVLSRVTAQRGIQSWRALKTYLKGILWLESACDVAGELLWDEMDSLHESFL
ncbi:hypothetical protein AJ80_07635 [Polytolypa hystricis UAMH7299]|uniref:Transcription factor domain-containing protein n=1 Tax=Polytolypa hystricis (strain UAMH7299) TaxID=1447883 RepID=A0A2B7XDF5_POLH7|nr:hypothetical protein AJ80_07635 [Polytolypa hystricis UAMH7299]